VFPFERGAPLCFVTAFHQRPSQIRASVSNVVSVGRGQGSVPAWCVVGSLDINVYVWVPVGRDSVVGIATRYELDGPGIESRWGRDFQQLSRPAPGAHPASCTMGTGSFPGVKRPGRSVDHPPPSSAEVKERVELYFYSPTGPSWPVLWWILPLLLYMRTHNVTKSICVFVWILYSIRWPV
jgi:hypothetical protein